MKISSYVRVIAGGAAVVSGGLGLRALLGWVFGWWNFDAPGAAQAVGTAVPAWQIPMAPSTAFIFVVVAICLGVQVLHPQGKLATVLAVAGSALSAGTGLVEVSRSIRFFPLPWDRWTGSLETQYGVMTTGRMALLTAINFILIGVVLLTTRAGPVRLRPARWVGDLAASVGALIAGLVLLAYAAGAPLDFDLQSIPMVLSTALAFFALFLARVLSAREGTRWWERPDLVRNESEGRQPSDPAKWRAIVGLAVILVGCGYAGFFYFRKVPAAVLDGVYEQLEILAQVRLREIAQWRRERIGDAEVFATSVGLSEAIARLAAGTPPGDEVTKHLAAMRAAAGYRAVALLDRELNPILTFPAELSGAWRPSPDTRQALADARGVIVEDFHRGRDGQIQLNLVVPVRNPGDQGLVGAVLLTIDAEPSRFSLLQSWPMASKSAETALVRREGNSTVFLSELRHKPDAPLNFRVPLTHPTLLAAVSLRSQNQKLSKGVDYRGVPVFGLARDVPGTPWSVLAKVDQTEAYAPMQQQARQLLLIFGMIVAVAVLVMRNWWQSQRSEELQRRLAAESLARATTERLALVMRHANDVILVFDERMRIVEANDRALEVYGYTAAEMQQLTAADLRSIETSASTPSDFAQALQSEGLAFETVHRRKNGSELAVEVRTRPVDVGGRRHVLSIIRDITERKRAEANLRRNEQQLRLFVEHSPAAIAMLDRDLRYLVVSRRWMSDYNLGDQAIVGRTHYEVFPDIPERWKQIHQRCLAGAVEKCEEDPFPRANGTTEWIRWEIHPWKDADGRIGGLIMFTEVISARKQAAEELQRSRMRLELATSAAQLGVWDWDVQRNELVWDDSMYRLYGVRREDFAGAYQAWLSCVHPDDAARAELAVQAALRGEKEFDPEYRIRRPADGAIRFIKANSVTLRDGEGRPYRMIGTNVDITERKEAEAELARTIELLERTGEMAKVGGWELDVATQRVTWSTETIRIHELDLPAEAALMSTGDRFYEPDAWKTVQAAVTAAIEGGKPYDLESPFITAKGNRIWVRVQGFPVIENGKTVKLRGTFQDITASVKAREALRASEERYRLIVETAREGIFLFDANWRLAFSNARFAEILGYTKDEIVGRHISEIILSEDAPAHEARKARQTAGIASTYENAYRTKSGAPVWLSVSVSPIIKDGVFTGSFGMVMDITERKRSEIALRESEQRLRLQAAALEATVNGVMITSPAGEIEWVNPAFSRITGYAFEEVRGKNPRLLKSGQERGEMYEQLWRTITAGDSWSGELVNLRKGGDLYTEELTITPVRDPDGRITHFVAVMQDITQRQSLEKQLAQAQRLESIGLLASGIAHDLNNIIAPISLSMEMLRMKYPEEDRLLAIVEQSARRGSDIVRQVLTFARGMGGNRKPLNVGRLIKEMSRLMGETLPRNIEITYDLETKEDTVHADPTQLHQVLLNLAVNARDAMPDGGKLHLALSKEVFAAGSPNLGLGAKPGDYVVITVSDTGSGIPPEIIPRIFEPFFTTKPRGQGTGLGLSTVHGIVTSHHGFIKVESTVGAGTTFKVYLPMARTDAAAADEHSARHAIAGGGRTILVADDEQTILEVTRSALTQHAFEVLLAPDGNQAIELFRAHRPEINLVILDRMMPGISGETAAAIIHQMDPAIPIVLATGLMRDGDPVEQETALKGAGIRAVLRKPFTAQQLLQVIADHLKENPPTAFAAPHSGGPPRSV